jgi:hypothetical protein
VFFDRKEYLCLICKKVGEHFIRRVLKRDDDVLGSGFMLEWDSRKHLERRKFNSLWSEKF